MSKFKVDIDTTAGFCFGVEKAIEEAEKHLAYDEPIYSLGQMVHNEQEIARLESLGLKTITTEDFKNISTGKVILRAHGEPPSTYTLAKENNIDLVDATCPIVKKLQERIRRVYESIDFEKEQILIFGKEGHPETIGLIGQTNGEALLLTSVKDLGKLDLSKKSYLFSQTTMDPETFKDIETALKESSALAGAEIPESKCTVCNQMKRRKPDLEQFARSYDLVLFVSGSASSNGAMLYQFCKSINGNTFWIHSVKDIKPQWFNGNESVGISGATSTPRWQLEKVKNHVISLIEGL